MRALAALRQSLVRRELSLVRLAERASESPEVLVELAHDVDAAEVHAVRDWSTRGLAEERAAAATLAAAGRTLVVHEAQLLVTPDALRTRSGGSYSVFTPFHRAWLDMIGLGSNGDVEGLTALIATGQHTDPDQADTHDEAVQGLERFVSERVEDYLDLHDIPGVAGTSELSPRLACGELSPRMVLAALGRHAAAKHDGSGPPRLSESARAFVRQLAWRDFAYHVVHHNPRMSHEPLRPEFAAFPWRENTADFAAWKEGRTGYPLVDAGMRQLNETGWMHNRVRMVAASFLVKHLLQPWQLGEQYFAEKLVDYDPALNAFNWQWVAGCGADAAPYFRIFNPTLQAQRFDADGAYVRRWVGDLSGDYPAPIVEHAEARARALAAYEAVKLAR